MKLLNSIYIKIVSWILVVSFIFVFVFNDYAYAKQYISQKAEFIRTREIEVPFEYGQVVEIYNPKSSQQKVILIQDLHANYEVQKNIKGILNYINENYGISRIGVEGNSSDVDVSLLSSIPREKVKEKVIDYFMKKGFITGPEEFVALSNRLVLEGLEDKELYEQATSLLLSSLNNHPQIVEYLEKIKYLLKILEDRICSSNLKRFRNQYILYKQDELSPYTFQKYLRGWAKEINIPVGRISEEYQRYIVLTERQESMDYKKIEKEYKKLLKALDLDYEGVSNLSITFKRFKTFFQGPESIREEMVKIVMSDPAYSNLRKYIDITELSKKLNTYKILGEENKVVEKISAGLCRNETEKDYLFITDYIQLLVKFLLNQITPGDLSEFYARAPEFKRRFNNLLRKYGNEFNTIDSVLLNLKPFIEKMGSFYDIARRRDTEFIKNFLGESLLSLRGSKATEAISFDEVAASPRDSRNDKRNDEKKDGNLVMVTGGFHTYGVAEQLKKENIPYTIIIPRVTSYTEENMRLYYSLLRGQEILSYEDMILQNLSLPSFLLKEWLQKRIVARATGTLMRDELKKHGYESRRFTDKVSDFIREWVKGYIQIRGDGEKFTFYLEDAITYEERLIFPLNINGERLMVGIKDGKLQIVSADEAEKIEQEAPWYSAVKRYRKARQIGDYANFLENLEVMATISGIKPVSRIKIENLDAEDIQIYLKEIDSNLNIISTEQGYFIYDKLAVLKVMTQANTRLRKEEQFNPPLSPFIKGGFSDESNLPGYLKQLLEQKDWKNDILYGFSIDDVIKAKRGDIAVSLTGEKAEVVKGEVQERGTWKDANPEMAERLASIRDELHTEKVSRIRPRTDRKFSRNVIAIGAIGVILAVTFILGGFVPGAILTGVAGLAGLFIMIRRRKDIRVAPEIVTKPEKAVAGSHKTVVAELARLPDKGEEIPLFPPLLKGDERGIVATKKEVEKERVPHEEVVAKPEKQETEEGITMIEQLLKEYRGAKRKPIASEKINFKGVGKNKDVYNISAPFKIKVSDEDDMPIEVIAGRVESREIWAESRTMFFKRTGNDSRLPHFWATLGLEKFLFTMILLAKNLIIANVMPKNLFVDIGTTMRKSGRTGNDWYPIPKSPVFEMTEDPFVTTIGDEIIIGGTEVTKEKGKTNYHAAFYRGSSLENLQKFAVGPEGMKDIRLTQIADGRILVITRPRGEIYGRGKIGYIFIDKLEELERMLHNKEIIKEGLIENLFSPSEWGGANELYPLKNGKVGVLGHVAFSDRNDNKHYYPVTFLFDPITKEASSIKIILTRSDLPEGPAKRSQLKNVIFGGGLIRHEDGTADLYMGVNDVEAYKATIPAPFSELLMEKEKFNQLISRLPFSSIPARDTFEYFSTYFNKEGYEKEKWQVKDRKGSIIKGRYQNRLKHLYSVLDYVDSFITGKRINIEGVDVQPLNNLAKSLDDEDKEILSLFSALHDVAKHSSIGATGEEHWLVCSNTAKGILKRLNYDDTKIEKVANLIYFRPILYSIATGHIVGHWNEKMAKEFIEYLDKLDENSRERFLRILILFSFADIEHRSSGDRWVTNDIIKYEIEFVNNYEAGKLKITSSEERKAEEYLNKAIKEYPVLVEKAQEVKDKELDLIEKERIFIKLFAKYHLNKLRGSPWARFYKETIVVKNTNLYEALSELLSDPELPTLSDKEKIIRINAKAKEKGIEPILLHRAYSPVAGMTFPGETPRILITDERWEHIISGHPDMAGKKHLIPKCLKFPNTKFFPAGDGALKAIGEVEGRILEIIYRETGPYEKFVITAYFKGKQLYPVVGLIVGAVKFLSGIKLFELTDKLISMLTEEKWIIQEEDEIIKRGYDRFNVIAKSEILRLSLREAERRSNLIIGSEQAPQSQEIATLLSIARNDIKIEIKINQNPAMLKEPIWAMAHFKRVSDTEFELYIHEAFLEALKTRGPPEGFTPETFLKLLVEHEIEEYTYLQANPDKAFKDFHQYLIDAKSPQIKLFEFINEIQKLKRITKEVISISGEEDFEIPQETLDAFYKNCPNEVKKDSNKVEGYWKLIRKLGAVVEEMDIENLFRISLPEFFKACPEEVWNNEKSFKCSFDLGMTMIKKGIGGGELCSLYELMLPKFFKLSLKKVWENHDNLKLVFDVGIKAMEIENKTLNMHYLFRLLYISQLEKSGDLLVLFTKKVFDEALVTQIETGRKPVLVFMFTGAEPLFRVAEIVKKSNPKYENIKLKPLYYTVPIRNSSNEEEKRKYLYSQDIFNDEAEIIFIYAGYVGSIPEDIWNILSKPANFKTRMFALEEDTEKTADEFTPSLDTLQVIKPNTVRREKGYVLQEEIDNLADVIDDGMSHEYQSPRSIEEVQSKLKKTSLPILYEMGERVLRQHIESLLSREVNVKQAIEDNDLGGFEEAQKQEPSIFVETLKMIKEKYIDAQHKQKAIALRGDDFKIKSLQRAFMLKKIIELKTFTYKKILKDTGFSRRTLDGLLQDLKKFRLVEVQERKGAEYLYTLKLESKDIIYQKIKEFSPEVFEQDGFNVLTDERFLSALKECEGNQRAAAEILRCSPPRVSQWVGKHSQKDPNFAKWIKKMQLQNKYIKKGISDENIKNIIFIYIDGKIIGYLNYKEAAKRLDIDSKDIRYRIDRLCESDFDFNGKFKEAKIYGPIYSKERINEMWNEQKKGQRGQFPNNFHWNIENRVNLVRLMLKEVNKSLENIRWKDIQRLPGYSVLMAFYEGSINRLREEISEYEKEKGELVAGISKQKLIEAVKYATIKDKNILLISQIKINKKIMKSKLFKDYTPKEVVDVLERMFLNKDYYKDAGKSGVKDSAKRALLYLLLDAGVVSYTTEVEEDGWVNTIWHVDEQNVTELVKKRHKPEILKKEVVPAEKIYKDEEMWNQVWDKRKKTVGLIVGAVELLSGIKLFELAEKLISMLTEEKWIIQEEDEIIKRGYARFNVIAKSEAMKQSQEIATLLSGARNDIKIKIKISQNLAMLKEGVWAMAHLKVNKKTGEVTLYIHEAFLEALKTRGPPAGMTVETFLKLLVEHEIQEYIEVNNPKSPFYKDYQAFHKHLYDTKSPQIKLFEFINEIQKDKKSQQKLERMIRSLAEQLKAIGFKFAFQMKTLNVLTGYRPACMLRVHAPRMEVLKNFAKQHPDFGLQIMSRINQQGKEVKSLIFYNKKTVESISQSSLKKLGVEGKNADEIVKSAIDNGDTVGILLGYALEDILGFKKKGGKIYGTKYTTWKTFPENKKEAEAAKQKLLRGEKIVEDVLMEEAIEKIYKNYPVSPEDPRCIREQKIVKVYNSDEFKEWRNDPKFWTELYYHIFILHPLTLPSDKVMYKKVREAIKEGIQQIDENFTNEKRFALINSLDKKYKLGKHRILVQKALLEPGSDWVFQQPINDKVEEIYKVKEILYSDNNFNKLFSIEQDFYVNQIVIELQPLSEVQSRFAELSREIPEELRVQMRKVIEGALKQDKELIRRYYEEQEIKELVEPELMAKRRKTREDYGALKNIGIYTDKDEKKFQQAKEKESLWLKDADGIPIKTRTIKGEEVTAKFITDDKNLPQGLWGYHFEDKDGNLIIITRSEYQDEAAYHEAKEAAWIKKIIARAGPLTEEEIRHQAHILASAEQISAFAEKDKLTPFHQRQLENMNPDQLEEIINEYDKGREYQHKVVSDYLREDALREQKEYEKVVRKVAEELLYESESTYSTLAKLIADRAENIVSNFVKKLNIISNIDWQNVKLRLMRRNFWTGLFTKSISRYPESLKLDDVVKFIISFISITGVFSILSGNLLFGLAIFSIYFGLNELGNVFTDKYPHFGMDIRKWMSREYIHPGKHSRSMFTSGVGTPIFAIVIYIVFWAVAPLSGLPWVLSATFIMANYGGVYNSYMRGKQYPEPNIRRAEYAKNFSLTFITCIIIFYAQEMIKFSSILPGELQAFLLLLFVSSSTIYLVFRKVFSDIWRGAIDLMGSFKIYEIGKEFNVALPDKNIPIYKPKEVSYLNIEGESGFFNKWKQNRKRKIEELKEEQIGDLINNLDESINKLLPYNLGQKEELKKFADMVLKGAKSFSLTEEGIKKLVKEEAYSTTMKMTHKVVGGQYEDWIEKYKLRREKLALACFLTGPTEEKKWEKILKYEQFKLQNIKATVLDEDIARQAGFSKERIRDGVFGDADTGCIIIITRKWDKLELLLKIEKARSKLEIFTQTCNRIKTENFTRDLINFHNQWYGYKEDPQHRQIRPVLEGKEQELMLEYINKLFVLLKKGEMKKPVNKRSLNKKELKNLPKLLEKFKKFYAFPEMFPTDLFNRDEMNNFILYDFVMEFIKFAEIKNPKTGKVLKNNQAKEFLDELLYFYCAKPNLGKNIWRAITEYTKLILKKQEMTTFGKFTDWFDEKVLSPKVILPVNTVFLIAISLFGHLPFQVYNFILVSLFGAIGISFKKHKTDEEKEKTPTVGEDSGAFKNIGIYTDKDEGKLHEAGKQEKSWKKQALNIPVETRTIKGEEVTAKFITEDKNLPQGLWGYHFEDKDGNLIIITRSEYQDEAAYHEAKEAAWIKKIIARAGPLTEEEIRHQAHILASAEQISAFAEKDKLTPFHQRQLENMNPDQLEEIINEYDKGREYQHKVVSDYLREDALREQEKYEGVVKEKAQGIIKDITAMELEPSNEELGKLKDAIVTSQKEFADAEGKEFVTARLLNKMEEWLKRVSQNEDFAKQTDKAIERRCKWINTILNESILGKNERREFVKRIEIEKIARFIVSYERIRGYGKRLKKAGDDSIDIKEEPPLPYESLFKYPFNKRQYGYEEFRRELLQIIDDLMNYEADIDLILENPVKYVKRNVQISLKRIYGDINENDPRVIYYTFLAIKSGAHFTKEKINDFLIKKFKSDGIKKPVILGKFISPNGVPLSLTKDRWNHIISEHPYMIGKEHLIKSCLENPNKVQRADEGKLKATRRMKGKEIVVVYKETSKNNGLIITAYGAGLFVEPGPVFVKSPVTEDRQDPIIEKALENVKIVILDVFGVLLQGPEEKDISRKIFEKIQKGLPEISIEKVLSELRDGKSLKEIFSKEEIQQIQEIVKKSLSDEYKFSSKIKEIIEEASQREVKIYAFSDVGDFAFSGGFIKEILVRILNSYYGDLFSDKNLIISQELGSNKEKEEAWKELLKKINANSKEVIMIDNKPGNIEAAENVGIKSFEFSEEKLDKKDVLIEEALEKIDVKRLKIASVAGLVVGISLGIVTVLTGGAALPVTITLGTLTGAGLSYSITQGLTAFYINRAFKKAGIETRAGPDPIVEYNKETRQIEFLVATKDKNGNVMNIEHLPENKLPDKETLLRENKVIPFNNLPKTIQNLVLLHEKTHVKEYGELTAYLFPFIGSSAVRVVGQGLTRLKARIAESQDQIRKTHDRLVLLQKMAGINSGTQNIDGVNKIADLMQEMLQGLGFKLRRVPGNNTGDHLVFTRITDIQNNPTVLFSGHMDTVYNDNTDPPKIFIDKKIKYIKGQGVLDMKGGLVVMLEVIKELKANRLLNKLNIVGICNADEETGSKDSRELIEELCREYPVDMAFVFEFNNNGEVITSRQGIGHFHNKIYDITAAEKVQNIILNLTGLTDEEKDNRVNVGIIDVVDARAPPEGFEHIVRFKVKVTGLSGHAGKRTEDGRKDSILEIARKITVLNKFIKEEDYIGRVLIYNRLIKGGDKLNRLPEEAVWYFDIYGDNFDITQRKGIADSINELMAGSYTQETQTVVSETTYEKDFIWPNKEIKWGSDYAAVEISGEYRFKYGKWETLLKEKIGKFLNCQLSEPHRPVMKENWAAAEILSSLGLAGAFNPSGSDANIIANTLNSKGENIVTFDGLGLTGEGAHSPDEYAVVKSMAERISLTLKLIGQLSAYRIGDDISEKSGPVLPFDKKAFAYPAILFILTSLLLPASLPKKVEKEAETVGVKKWIESFKRRDIEETKDELPEHVSDSWIGQLRRQLKLRKGDEEEEEIEELVEPGVMNLLDSGMSLKEIVIQSVMLREFIDSALDIAGNKDLKLSDEYKMLIPIFCDENGVVRINWIKEKKSRAETFYVLVMLSKRCPDLVKAVIENKDFIEKILEDEEASKNFIKYIAPFIGKLYISNPEAGVALLNSVDISKFVKTKYFTETLAYLISDSRLLFNALNKYPFVILPWLKKMDLLKIHKYSTIAKNLNMIITSITEVAGSLISEDGNIKNKKIFKKFGLCNEKGEIKINEILAEKSKSLLFAGLLRIVSQNPSLAEILVKEPLFSLIVKNKEYIENLYLISSALTEVIEVKNGRLYVREEYRDTYHKFCDDKGVIDVKSLLTKAGFFTFLFQLDREVARSLMGRKDINELFKEYFFIYKWESKADALNILYKRNLDLCIAFVKSPMFPRVLPNIFSEGFIPAFAEVGTINEKGDIILKDKYRDIFKDFQKNGILNIEKIASNSVISKEFSNLAAIAKEDLEIAGSLEKKLLRNKEYFEKFLTLATFMNRFKYEEDKIIYKDFIDFKGLLKIKEIAKNKAMTFAFMSLGILAFYDKELALKVSELDAFKSIMENEEYAKVFANEIAINLPVWYKNSPEILNYLLRITENYRDFQVTFSIFNYIPMEAKTIKNFIEHIIKIKDLSENKDKIAYFLSSISLFIKLFQNQAISQNQTDELLNKLFKAGDIADYQKWIREILSGAVKSNNCLAPEFEDDSFEEWQKVLIRGIAGKQGPKASYYLDKKNIVKEISKLLKQLGVNKEEKPKWFALGLCLAFEAQFHSPQVTEWLYEKFHHRHLFMTYVVIDEENKATFKNTPWNSAFYNNVVDTLGNNPIVYFAEFGHVLASRFPVSYANKEIEDRTNTLLNKLLQYLMFENAGVVIENIYNFGKGVLLEKNKETQAIVLKALEKLLEKERLFQAEKLMKQEKNEELVKLFHDSEFYNLGKLLYNVELEIENPETKLFYEFARKGDEYITKEEKDYLVGIFAIAIASYMGHLDIITGPYEEYRQSIRGSIHPLAERITQDLAVRMVILSRKLKISPIVLPYITAGVMEWLLTNLKQKDVDDWQAVVEQIEKIDSELVEQVLNEKIAQGVIVKGLVPQLNFEDILSMVNFPAVVTGDMLVKAMDAFNRVFKQGGEDKGEGGFYEDKIKKGLAEEVIIEEEQLKGEDLKKWREAVYLVIEGEIELPGSLGRVNVKDIIKNNKIKINKDVSQEVSTEELSLLLVQKALEAYGVKEKWKDVDIAKIQGFFRYVSLLNIGVAAKERIANIRALLPEIEKELAAHGTGYLPGIALISDFHGDISEDAHFVTDKFGFPGSYVLIVLKEISQWIIELPDMTVLDKKTGIVKIIKSPALPGREFLRKVKIVLEKELAELELKGKKRIIKRAKTYGMIAPGDKIYINKLKEGIYKLACFARWMTGKVIKWTVDQINMPVRAPRIIAEFKKGKAPITTLPYVIADTGYGIYSLRLILEDIFYRAFLLKSDEDSSNLPYLNELCIILGAT